MLISICLVVRDGAHFLSRTLNSIKSVADEIVMVNTGSFDGTDAIAQEYGASVFHCTCSLNAARNYALKKAKGKWILYLEQNEELGDDFKQLRPLLRETDSAGFYLPVINYKLDQEFYMPRLTLRLFRQDEGCFFEEELNEQPSDILINKNKDLLLRVLQLPIIRHLPSEYSGEIKENTEQDIQPLDLYDPEEELLQKDNSSGLFSLLKAATAFYKKGEIIYALNQLEEKLGSYSGEEYAKLLENIIFLLFELRKYKQAIKIINQGLKKYPEKGIFLIWQGFFYYKARRYESALKSLDKGLSGDKTSSRHVKNKIYLLLGLIYKKMGDENKARFYLEYASNFFPDNMVVLNNLIDLLPEKNGSSIFKYLAGKERDNKKVRLMLIKLFYEKGYYEEALQVSELFSYDEVEDIFCFWRGKIFMQLNKYREAQKELKSISPGYKHYREALDLLWLINIKSPARPESRSVTNQIKLLGDKLSWQIIKLFNQIYYYGKEVLLEFNNMVAKLRFYRRSLYYLKILLEFNSSRAAEVMLEIIRTLKVRSMSGDLGLVFYQQACWNQAYFFFKNSTKQGEVLSELLCLADCCYHLGKDEEEKAVYKKIARLDSGLYDAIISENNTD